MTDEQLTELYTVNQGLQQSAIHLMEFSELVTQEHDSAELIELISSIGQKNLARAVDFLQDNLKNPTDQKTTN